LPESAPFGLEDVLPIGRIVGKCVKPHFLTNHSKALESGKSIALIPGGSEELLESNPDQEIVVIAKRKGFIRLALMYGCDLVPCYAFGVNDLYTQVKKCDTEA
jgi:hypothetical protein